MPPQLSPEQSQSLCHHTGDMSVTVSPITTLFTTTPIWTITKTGLIIVVNTMEQWNGETFNHNSIIYSTQNEKINSILISHKFRQPRSRTIFVSSLPFIILLFTSWSSLTSFCQTLWVLPQTQKAEQNLRWQQAEQIGNYSVIFALLNTFFLLCFVVISD